MGQDDSPATFGRRRRWTRVLGLSEILILAAWIGIWALWPKGGHLTLSYPPLPKPRVSYIPEAENVAELHVRPDLIARLSTVGWAVPLTDEVVLDALPLDDGGPRFLEPRETASPESLNLLSDDRGSALGRPPALDYRLRLLHPKTFRDAGGRQMKLFARMSGDLRRVGFTMPDIDLDELTNPGSAWQVRLSVEVGADGTPEYVFLETPSDDPEVNDLVVRHAYRGRVKDAGQPVQGQITVSYGVQ